MSEDTLQLTASESLRIVSSTPEAVVVEATYGPGGSPPPKHLHPSQDEHFEVLEGELHTRVDGNSRTVKAGETIDIPRTAVHQMWNPGDATARVTWTTSPGLRTEEWFRAVDAANRKADGEPGPLTFGVLIDRYSDTFRLAVGPQILMTPLVKVLATGGRLLGRG